MVTIALIVAVSAVSLVSYAHPAVTEALERRPGALGHWQLWRLVSPLLGGLVVGVWLALIHDIHGPALLAGLGTGVLLLVLVPGLTGRQSGGDLFNRLAGLGPGAGAARARTAGPTTERLGGPHGHR